MKIRTVLASLLAGATALVPTPALAMPGMIAAAVIPLITSATTVGIFGFTGVAAIGLGIGYAATFGALYLVQSALRPDAPAIPKPEDGKSNLKQPVPHLSFAVGYVRKGGDYTLYEERNGVAYHIIVFAGHRINRYTRFWLHDEEVTLDGSGWVTAPAHFAINGGNLVRVLSRRGLDAETAYAPAVSAMPEIWGNNHRGDGLASAFMSVKSVSQENHLKAYPNQMPHLTAELEGVDLYDPRDGVWRYSTNLALIRLWHLTHPVGGKLTLDDMYLPEWAEAADVCDEIVTNRSGGSEKRYHGGFWFRANNDPVEVGRIMDQAAELVVYERPDGKVGVHPGKFVVPDIRIDQQDIIACSFDANKRMSSNVLAVRGKYTKTDDGSFTTVDAAPYGDPYVDDTQRTRTVENQAVQSHNHMARLEKITYTRANAPRVKLVATYQAAKLARYRRFVRLNNPPYLDEAVIEITGKPKLSLRNMTVEIEGIVVPPTLYDFDAATEEGAPGSPIIPLPPSGVPVPENFAVLIRNEIVSGGETAAYAEGSWTHVSDALVYELEWQPSAGGTKQTVLSTSGESSVRTGYLADGSEYRFRLRTWSGGTSSDWTDYVLRTATADPNAPDPATGVSATGGAGEVTFNWTCPNSGNYFASRLYLHTSNDFGSATLVATEYGAANDAETRTITGLSAGTYYGWVEAINASGVAASPVPTGSITVT